MDTDQIKKDYLNTSTSAMSPKSKPGSIHFKNDVVQIKLTRNPDRHFYDFIKEYGVIM